MDHSHAGPANIAQTMDYNEVDEYLNFTSRQAQFFIAPKLCNLGPFVAFLADMEFVKCFTPVRFLNFSDGIFILLMQ